MGSCISKSVVGQDQCQDQPIEIKNKVEHKHFKTILNAFEYTDQIVNAEDKIRDKYLTNEIEVKKIINNGDVINIMYLEDNEIYFILMKHIFDQYINNDKINLVRKTTIDDAYNFIVNNDVHLIFLDRVIGKNMRGDDLYNKLKDEKYDVSNIIFISAIDNLKDIDYYEKNGIKYFIKPLKIERFVKFINNIII